MSCALPIVVSTAVEGIVDEAVARRLVHEAGATLGPVYGKAGKVRLLERLPGYNRAAHWSPWVVFVDLDQDADCAPPFCAECLPHPASRMCFRVVVREVEAWLLADAVALARFLSVPASRVPQLPEALPDPKHVLVELARHSRRRDICEDMVPRAGSSRRVGPAYASRLIEFAENCWRPEIAAGHSDSLRRCRARLQQLAEAG